jgi:hypothetical protein
MRSSTRTFREWRVGPSAAGDPARGEYNAVNAQVYENGTLGPRPGWKEIAYSTGTRVHDDSSDGLRSIMWYQESDADENLLVVFRDASDGDAWKFDTLDLETNTFAAGQTLSDIANGAFSLYPNDYPGDALLPAIFDGSIMSAIGPHLLFATSNSPGTVATVTTSDGDARVVTVNRERAYYWGINGAPGRIYFSDPADFSTIQSTSSFDVNADKDSYAGAPIGVWSVKNALLIACKDNRWATLTGASPENGSFKELGHDVVPVHGTSVVVDNQVWFLSPTGQGVVIATPSFVEPAELSYLSPLAYPGSVLARPNNSVVPKPAVGDDVNSNLFLPAIVDGDEDVVLAVERVNGVFALSQWDTDADCDEIVFSSGRPNELYAARNANSDWDIFSRNHTLNRPANSGDTKSVSLANEAATSGGTNMVIDLGETLAGDGKIIRPTKVVLDIDYWKGGNYSAPELAIDATVLGTESSSPEDSLAQQTVTTSGWADSVGDTPFKRRVPVVLPQSQFGTRFLIRITADNLALDSVQVYYDEQDDNR